MRAARRINSSSVLAASRWLRPAIKMVGRVSTRTRTRTRTRTGTAAATKASGRRKEGKEERKKERKEKRREKREEREGKEGLAPIRVDILFLLVESLLRASAPVKLVSRARRRRKRRARGIQGRAEKTGNRYSRERT